MTRNKNIRVAALGSRPFTGDVDLLKQQIPMYRHPPPEMSQAFVARFVAENPAEFKRLCTLIQSHQDLVSVIRTFEEFLDRSGFDRKYFGMEIFGALCDAARSANAERSKS
jgi:hypothetical protein